ncbi:metal-dependent membrane protease [Candidatus Scalindua japonica]|uniref:Metal-dependent membrane protease n=2 Tax=Candidatus Scalindua japonica TaxID=1284222 RepID=A0A286TZH1_9BACT|nr:metal-dependent membrane protease [Candidatus Scalindua japonica]
MMFAGIPVFLYIVKQISGLDLVERFGQNTVFLSLSLVVNILTCLYIFNIVRTGYGLPVVSLGLTIRDWKSDVKTGLKHYLIILPVILASGFIVDFVLRAFGIDPEQQNIINNLLREDSSGVLAFMVFFGMFAAPIVEEILFRGFMQSAVRIIYDKRQTIFISGFVFALIHWNAHVFLQIFILGLLLAYLYEKTGTLVASITVHVCHNTTTLVFLISFKYFLKSHV